MTSNTFWRNLVCACTKKKMTVSALCDKVGISRSMVTKWRNGSVPRIGTLSVLAEELNVTVGDLLADEETKKEYITIGSGNSFIARKTVPANNIIKEVDADTMGKIINSVLRMNSEQLKSLDKYIAFLLSQEEQ